MDLKEFKEKALPARNKLFRLAKRLLKNIEEAEDTVQEVFIKLWQKRNELDKYNSIEAFAYAITKNLCIDKLRKKKYIFTEIYDETMSGKSIQPDKSYEQNETFEIINKIIDDLPNKQKIVMQLRDIEGMEMNEVAGILETSVGNVRVQLSRARKQVRSILLKTNEFYYGRN